MRLCRRQQTPETTPLIPTKMRKQTLAMLFALVLSSAHAMPHAQQQAEEGHPGNAVSCDLAQLVAQKGIVNAYDAIGALPGIVVQNGVYTLAGRAIAVSINGDTQNVPYDQLQELLLAMPASGIERAEIVYNPAARLQAGAPLVALTFKSKDSESQAFAAEVGGDVVLKHRTMFGQRAAATYKTGNLMLELSYRHDHGRAFDALKTEVPELISHHLESYTNTQERLAATSKHSYRLAATITFGAHHWLTATYQGFNHNSDVTTDNTFHDLGAAEDKAKAWLHNPRIDYVTPFGIRLGVEATIFRAPETSSKTRYVDLNWVDYGGGGSLPSIWPTDFVTTDSLRTETWRAYIAGEHALRGGWTINYGAWFKKTKHRSEYLTTRAPLSYSHIDIYPEEHFTTAYAGVGKQMGEKWAAELSVSGDYFYNQRLTQWRLLPTFNISFMPSEGCVWALSVSGSRGYPSYMDMNAKRQFDNGGRLYTHGNMYVEPSLIYQAQLSYVVKDGFQLRTWYNRAHHHIMQQPSLHRFFSVVILENTNIDRHQQVGLQTVMPHRFGPRLYTCLTVGGAWTQDKGENTTWEGAVDSKKLHVEGQFTGIATLCAKPNIALSVDAYAKTKSLQGRWELPAYAKVDMGLRWMFLKDMATLRLFCNDVLAGGTQKRSYKVIEEHYNLRAVAFREVGMSLTMRF